MIRTAVLGSGVIGASWIEAFLAGGCAVTAWDPDPRAAVRLSERHGGTIVMAETPEAAVSGAAFVQESGPERLADKRSLLARIAAHVGERTIVASSTSTLLPSDIQKDLAIADRFVIGHPFNPPHILPLVEVLGGAQTEVWAVEEAMRFYSALGKHPIHLRRERPGHLANRLQAALWREAVDAVACGQASVDDVDAAVRLALGPRWALMGPFATFNLGGGKAGLAHFLDHLGLPLEALWDDAHRPVMDARLKQSLVEATGRLTGARPIAELTAERNEGLRKVLAVARGSSDAVEGG